MIDAVKNFGKVTVSTTYNASDVTIVLTGGDGAKLPNPSTDGEFNVVWWNNTDYSDPSDDPNVEIVRCTVRSTDTLTVTRAQEDTSGTTKSEGGKTYLMALTLTAKTITDLEQWQYEDTDDAGTYIYYGYSRTGTWQIRRKTVATLVWEQADGTGSYATAWAARVSGSYS